MNFGKKIIKTVVLVFVVIMSTLCLCSCQSTDKKDSYFNHSAFEQATFEFEENKNKTKVVFNALLTNNTIYKINDFSITIKLYNDSELKTTQTYDYNRSVKNGESYAGSFYFYADGEIDCIEYVSWTANYTSFWKTYETWFIISIILLILVSIVYTIVVIINDLDFDDLLENWWFFVILLIIVGGSEIGAVVASNWVCGLIVLGAVIAFVIWALVLHLIRGIF